MALFSFARGNGEDGAEGGLEVMEGFEQVVVAGVDVQWQVDGGNLNVQITSGSTGWVALGFDPSSRMKDANIIIGYISDGDVFIRDDFGVAAVKHESDAELGGSEDITNVEGQEADGGTQISFTIPLDSGDDYDKPLVPGKKYKIIVAMGPDDADDFGTYHTSNRGSAQIEL